MESIISQGSNIHKQDFYILLSILQKKKRYSQVDSKFYEYCTLLYFMNRNEKCNFKVKSNIDR